MKCYLPYNYVSYIDENISLLHPVTYSNVRRMIAIDTWGNGWMCEIDTEFETYFTVLTGKRLPTISNEEYKHLVFNAFLFFGKARNLQFLEALLTL